MGGLWSSIVYLGLDPNVLLTAWTSEPRPSGDPGVRSCRDRSVSMSRGQSRHGGRCDALQVANPRDIAVEHGTSMNIAGSQINKPH